MDFDILKKRIILFLCFLLPTMVMLFAFAAYGIAPFGDKSILIMDMSGQYNEFFLGLKDFGKNSNLFFSWSKSLGTSNIGLVSYYLSSPLSLLTLFVSDIEMPIFLVILTALKVGLAGFSFAIFLSYMKKDISPYMIIFSLFYGLMSYNIVYSMCLMWLDGVIWLPIILIGIEKILKKEKPYLLIISLFILFISNYYIAYMVGAFSLIFFIYRYLLAYKDENILKRGGAFIGSALIAALLAAWFLLPTLASLAQGKIGGNNYTPTGNINFELKNLVSKLFLGAYDNITNNGMPFLYVSVMVTILFVGFFFLKKVSVKEKIITFIITAFMLASFYITKLDLVWHIFQYPNWFPYRYSFVFLFFTIYIAYRTFTSIEDLPISFFVSFTIVGLIISMLMMRIKYSYLKVENIELTMKLLIFYILILFILHLIKSIKIDKWKMKKLASSLLIFSLLIFVSSYELYKHSTYLFAGLDRVHTYEAIDGYRSYRIGVNSLLEETAGDEEFYRINKSFSRSFNEPISFNYKGIDHYSSAYNRQVNSLIKNLGFSSDYLWASSYGSTIVTDSILNTRYIMSLKPETDKYKLLKTVEGVDLYRKSQDKSYYGSLQNLSIYENPNYLSPAFMADIDLIKNPLPKSNIFENQNYLLQKISGQSTRYFTRINPFLSLYDAKGDQEKRGYYSRTSSTGIIKYSFNMEEAGEIYAYFPFHDNSPNCSVYVNDVYITELYYGQFDCSQFLGSFKEGDQVNIELHFTNSFINLNAVLFYKLNYEAFSCLTDSLKEGNLEIESYKAGYIKGTVNAKEDGYLFTSIPDDKGWSVYVDGKKVESEIFAEALLTIKVQEGIHHIKFVYKHQGLVIGIIVSSVTLVAITSYYIIRFRKKLQLPSSL